MRKKILIYIIVFLIPTGLIFSQEKIPTVQISLHGVYNLFGSTGSDTDYEVGVNEFPLVDSHGSFGTGLRFSFDPYEFVVVGMEFFLNFRSTATVRDPQDGDQADIDTYRNVQGFLTLRFHPVRLEKISLFIEAGIGGYYMMDDSSQSYTTQQGFILETEPAEQEYGLAGFGGVGMEYHIHPFVNLSVSGRYVYLASDPSQSSISVLFGIGFLL